MVANRRRIYEQYSWIVLFLLGLMLTLSTFGILLMGADPPRQFETDTGVDWALFESDYPSVARLVTLYELLLASGFFGCALFATGISVTKFRSGERWAWYILWIFPLILALASLLFFSHEQAYVGYFYAGASLLGLLAMALSYRRFFPASS